MRIQKTISRVAIVVAVLGSWFVADSAYATITLKNICHVKGQEENTLQGLGLVIGLKGTGDSPGSLPSVRALAQAIQLLGTPVGKRGALDLKDDIKNVALVMVTATVPGAGARQGDKLDCTVSSIGGAKSLNGGQLFITALQGPNVNSDRVYAFAQGEIHLDDLRVPTTGKVFNGCRMEADFFNPFIKDGKITLVLEKNHADFEVAQSVADWINSQLGFRIPSGEMARALNQQNIEVIIPPQDREKPVSFIAEVLSLRMVEAQPVSRVVINERAGSIVISGDIEIGAVVITHKNMVIDTGGLQQNGAPPTSHFVPLDTGINPPPKLKALVEMLNTLKVPTDDVIEIIKGLDRNGKLHGELIIE
jgi:flagellar P-ring protein precursor FlgI